MNWYETIQSIADKLESIASPRIASWQFLMAQSDDSPVLHVNMPAQDWKTVATNQKVPAPAGWFKAVIEIPETMAGVPTLNRQIKILFSTWGVAHIFADGMKTDRVFLIGESPLGTVKKVGQKIECMIFADYKCGVTFIEWANWRLDYKREFFDEIIDFATSLRAGSELLQRNTLRKSLYAEQNHHINKLDDENEVQELRECLVKSAQAVDIEAIQKGDFGSIRIAKEISHAVAQYSKKFTIHLIGHSHIDLAWKWRKQEAYECTRGTIKNQIELMKKHPEYVFVESSPCEWEEISEKDPALFEEMKRMVAKGQLEPVGGMWCETDSNLVGAESWARHFLYANDFVKKHFGKPFKTGWNIDAFGFHANLPQFYVKANINAFVTQKLRYNESNLFPHLLFWWQAKDGSRIL